MARYQPVRLPSYEPTAGPEPVAIAIGRWARSAPLRDLVGAFGGQLPTGDTADILAYLDAFSARHWDFRAGRERLDATEPRLADPTHELVAAAADALGMRSTRAPTGRAYTHLLVLGGIAHACLPRAYHAGQLVAAGAIEAAEVTALSSFRYLRPEEYTLLTALGIHGCRYEVDVLTAGTRTAFTLGEPDKTDGQMYPDPDTDKSWSAHTYRSGTGLVVHILAAPSSQPAVRRATTVDTYHHWARQVTLTRHDRVLLVTTAIYVPYQHCDAIRILGLPYGCAVDTVGVDPALVTEPLLGKRYTTGNYLQEIRSSICSMGRLLRAVRDA